MLRLEVNGFQVKGKIIVFHQISFKVQVILSAYIFMLNRADELLKSIIVGKRPLESENGEHQAKKSKTAADDIR